jgi:hypothetical protein
MSATMTKRPRIICSMAARPASSSQVEGITTTVTSCSAREGIAGQKSCDRDNGFKFFAVNERFQFEALAAISDNANFKIMTFGLENLGGLGKHRDAFFRNQVAYVGNAQLLRWLQSVWNRQWVFNAVLYNFCVG